MPEIKCFCHCHIGKWISSLDCQCFHGMHQTKCSHCESPKPAQLAEEKGCPDCGSCEAGSHFSPCDQEIEEPFPQSPLTQEDRELLEGWPKELKCFSSKECQGYKSCQDCFNHYMLIEDLLEAKDREADEKIQGLKNQLHTLITCHACRATKSMINGNLYCQKCNLNPILNPESPSNPNL